MRAEDRMRNGRGVAAIAIAAVLLAALSAGCRTANAGITPDPGLKAVAGPSEAAEIAALPAGGGKSLVTERCLLCHGAGLITQQRKDAAAWGRTVTQMRTWGTVIQDEEQTTLITYLSENFGSGGVRR